MRTDDSRRVCETTNFLGEGRLAEAVRDAAASTENVHYPGAFEYRLMPGFLAHADVGFCFKDAEQPLKLKEYGAAGIPAIVQPGELQRWYDENELLFVEPEPAAISAELEALAADERRRQQYGQALQQHAREYSWDDIAAEYSRLFERIA